MSIPITIPLEANPLFPALIFSTTFNAITPGLYDFTNDPTNQKQVLITLNNASVYIIEGYLWSMSTDEGTWHTAINPTNGTPRLRLTTLRSGQAIYTNDFPLINNLNDFEIVQFLHSTQSGDQLLVSYVAQFNQTGALIGVPILYGYLQIVLYEIQSTLWTGRYFDIKQDYGKELEFRGRHGGR